MGVRGVSVQQRTIPTRVGRTIRVSSQAASSRTIPTRVGRTFSLNSENDPARGPSPRGWGEHGRNIQNALANRTIPTRVGRTHGYAARRNYNPDHPHAGGENHND